MSFHALTHLSPIKIVHYCCTILRQVVQSQDAAPFSIPAIPNSPDGEGSEGLVDPAAGELKESDEECSEDGVTSDKDNLLTDENTEVVSNKLKL